MAIKKTFTDESFELFVDKIKEYTDNAVSQSLSTCVHDELTNEQIDAILGPLDGVPDDDSGDSGSGSSTSTTDIELDGTLTQSGMAADAKVVGDRLATKANVNHTHSVSSIDNLQTLLSEKASSTHTHNVATASSSGFMSIADKTKLNAIESGANKTIVDSTLSSSSTNPVQNKAINSALAGKANAEHAHNYAGSTSSGGAANSANKLNTNAGSSVKPVYFENGVPVATTYTIEKSVPSDAVFTDTTYSVATDTNDGLMSSDDKVKLDGISDNIDSALSGKANAIHTHIVADVTDLQTVLNGKSDSNHNHDSVYDAKGSANNALESAKSYADSVSTTAATTVKNDLLNGAGEAYDTLKELGDLINTNVNAIDALETVATGKAEKVHAHTISDVIDLQSALDNKSDSSHNHDEDYDEKGAANTALVNAKSYIDEAISNVNTVLASTVKTINNIVPDTNGNVVINTGFDSWTESDKAGMLQYMLDSIPNGDVVSY